MHHFRAKFLLVEHLIPVTAYWSNLELLSRTTQWSTSDPFSNKSLMLLISVTAYRFNLERLSRTTQWCTSEQFSNKYLTRIIPVTAYWSDLSYTSLTNFLANTVQAKSSFILNHVTSRIESYYFTNWIILLHELNHITNWIKLLNELNQITSRPESYYFTNSISFPDYWSNLSPTLLTHVSLTNICRELPNVVFLRRTEAFDKMLRTYSLSLPTDLIPMFSHEILSRPSQWNIAQAKRRIWPNVSELNKNALLGIILCLCIFTYCKYMYLNVCMDTYIHVCILTWICAITCMYMYKYAFSYLFGSHVVWYICIIFLHTYACVDACV